MKLFLKCKSSLSSTFLHNTGFRDKKVKSRNHTDSADEDILKCYILNNFKVPQTIHNHEKKEYFIKSQTNIHTQEKEYFLKEVMWDILTWNKLQYNRMQPKENIYSFTYL